MKDTSIYDMWFILCKIDNIDKINLIEIYQTPYEIWRELFSGRLNIKSLYIKKMREAWDEDRIRKFTEYLKINSIDFIIYKRENYPEKLINIQNPPFVVFYKGNISVINDMKGVAIVGSRNCTAYGSEAAKFIVKDLVKSSINIISGGARGIDSFAHRSAIQSGGVTTVVLGCGIDKCYPSENKWLFDEVKKKGIIVSEFLPGTPPYAFNFPMRNRLISGLSNGVVVVEAAEKSGTNTTVEFALAQGRDVFAVPGSIFSSLSRGCTKIIMDGGIPFTTVKDLLIKLGVEENCGINRNIIDPIKKLILGLIQDTPIHIEEISKVTNIDIKVLYGLLFEMQLEETILCLSGNFYVKAT